MKRTITLSPQVHRCLKRLHEGGRLRATRIFPFPHKYILSKPDGSGDYAGGMAVDTISALVQHGLCEATQGDKMGDSITYTLTDAGVKVAETGALTYDDQNAEMFAT